MTRLERGYRRLLACYPRAFRQENEDEIIAVLMATAPDGQTRIRLAEAADLLRGALRARLRPGMFRPPRTIQAAIRLMSAGALLEAALGLTVLMSAGSVHAAVLRHYPSVTAAQWHGVAFELVAMEIGAPASALVWIWLAWANSRGREWAKFAFLSWFTLLTVLVLVRLGMDAAALAPAMMIASGAIWLDGAATIALLFNPRSARHYRQQALAVR